MPMMIILLGGLVLALTNMTSWNNKTREQAIQQTTVRSILDGFKVEVREAFPIDPGTGVATPILTATSSGLTFYAPDRTATSSNGISSFKVRKIAYQFTGTRLERQSVTSTNAYQVMVGTTSWTFPSGTFPSSSGWIPLIGPSLSPPVTGSFTYYDASGAVLASPVTSTNLIDQVRITITAKSGGTQTRTTTYTETAAIRETQSA
jgi:hypothetical protein